MKNGSSLDPSLHPSLHLHLHPHHPGLQLLAQSEDGMVGSGLPVEEYVHTIHKYKILKCQFSTRVAATNSWQSTIAGGRLEVLEASAAAGGRGGGGAVPDLP